MTGIRLGAVAMLLLMVTGCAPFSARPDAEALSAAQAVADRMAQERSRYRAASALVQATTTSHGKLQLWPHFTAVLRYTAPDRVSIEGYSELGIPLFSFHSENGRYQFTASATGEIRSGNLNSLLDPVARVLTDLSHLLDGAVGIDLKGALPRADGGGWRIQKDGVTTTFRLNGNRVTHLNLDRRGRPPTEIEFTDFRPLDAGVAPYRITVVLAGYKAHLSVEVMEWHRTPS